jgi:polysaccharide deacetylase family protein (PEP-CTERM system associated)
LKKPQAGFREGQMNGETQQFDGTFTVDVEDYFQVSAFSSVISPGDWRQYDCRVEQNTRRVLDVAAECGTRGTFFVLGWVAKHYPGLVSEIQDAGHEIGGHSHWHQLVYELGPDRFRSDLQESRDTLEQIIGKPVTLYRSPSFSITEKSLWALDILIEEGFDTDSSIYPVHHDRYGIPDAPTMPHIIKTAAGAIREFRRMVYQFGRTKLPVGGAAT